MLLQLSNSNSNPSMSQKMAKLEARMAGKAAPMSPQTPWLSAHSELMSTKSNGVTTISSSGDSDSDDAGEFVIQPNPRLTRSNSQDNLHGRKRERVPEANTKRSRQVKEVAAARIAWQEEMQEISQLEEEITSLQTKNSSLEEEMGRLRKELANAHNSIKRFEKDLKERTDKEQHRDQKRIKVVSDLLVQLATVERQEARSRLQQECNRLGNVGVMRARTVLSEVWEDGQAFKDVQSRLRSLMELKTSLEKRRKELKKQPSDGSSGEPAMSEEDVLAMEEVYRFRLLGVKREEEAVLKDRDRLEQEKKCLIRELKRCRDEDASPFNHFPIMNKRYALLNLLGKGGFSEVYKDGAGLRSGGLQVCCLQDA